MSYLTRITDYYRIKDWFYHLGFIYLGMVYASGNHISLRHVMIGSILGCLYLAGGYSYNKLCDLKEVNKINLISSLGCHAIFLLLGSYYFKENNIFFVIAVLLNIFYSHPKYLLKSKHNLRVFLNGYFFGILFLLGSLIILGRLDKGSCLMTLFFILIMYPYEIIHEISHFESDEVKCAVTLLKSYKRQIYLLLLISSIASYVLFYFLRLNLLFMAASLLFNAVFFIITFHINRPNAFKSTGTDKSRIALRYLGLFYGLLLWLSFVKRI